MLGIIDDHSRLCCHAQWYLAEGAEELCHGLCQAFQKRALPRALMSDKGSAMLAAETTEGLARLSILHETTLPYAPFQNGKQESFWNGVEGRLLPMLEGVVDLTLDQLGRSHAGLDRDGIQPGRPLRTGRGTCATLSSPPRRGPVLSR
jgi:putative transposase